MFLKFSLTIVNENNWSFSLFGLAKQLSKFQNYGSAFELKEWNRRQNEIILKYFKFMFVVKYFKSIIIYIKKNLYCNLFKISKIKFNKLIIILFFET